MPTTHWLWVRGGAGVGTRHQPHSARSCELALRAVGAARGRPGGGASCLGVERPGSGALPPPTARPLGGLSGPTTHWLWVRGGAGVGTRHQPHSARSCVLWGRHDGGRGGRLPPGCGASGVGRSPTPDCPPSGRAAGAHYPLAVVAGGCGRGDPSPTPQRALLRAGFARCGGDTRALGGGAPPAWVWGVRGPLPAGRGCGVRARGPGCPWHLVPCRGSSCVVRASRVRGTRWPLWLGTCPRAMVVAGGVPLWRASWPRVGAPPLVRSRRFRCSSRLSRRRGAFSHPGGCRPRLYWVAARGTWRPAENRAHCACRWPLPGALRVVPVRGSRWGCPWRVPPASVLGCVRCDGLACVDPVTDACGFPYRPSCNGGLGRCTGAVLCGRRHRPFRVGGRHARVPCVCAWACPACPGRAGRPPGRVSVRLTFSFGRSWFALCLFGPLRTGVAPCVVVVGVFFFLFLFPFSPSLRPRCVLLCVFSGPGCLGPWRLVLPPPFFFPPPPLCAPLSPALRVFRPGVPWALASCCPPLLFFFSFFFPSFFAGCALRGGIVCLGPSGVPRRCCPCRCSVCAGWCCVVLAVGPGCPLLSPGGSWCHASVVLSLSGRVARRPVVRCGVSWCSAALCCVLLRGAVVW